MYLTEISSLVSRLFGLSTFNCRKPSPCAFNRYTSLGFLNEEEKIGTWSDSRHVLGTCEFIHLKDAYSFGICYPLPSPQCQEDLTDRFYLGLLCYLKQVFWLRDFQGGNPFLRH